MSAYPSASFLTSAYRPDQFVADEGIEIAFAGRSNAGKSTAINAIVQRRNFARTSKTPGRTQLVNFFHLRDGERLVDLPGYGYARVPPSLKKHWQGLMSAYFGHRRSLHGLMLIVDARRGLSEFDWQMLDWAAVAECRVHVLLTKADKLKPAEAERTLTQARRDLKEVATVQIFSGTKRTGVDTARDRLERLLQS